MSLVGGDLTTPARYAIWASNPPSLPSAVISQLITSMSNLIRGKLNRGRLYSRTITSTIDGPGNYQIILPLYPVTSITQIQMGAALILPSPLPNPTTGVIPPPNFAYGYRFVPWNGELPSEPSVVEFVHGVWLVGAQNIQVTYNAGYLTPSEPGTIPANPGPYTITVLQPDGLWCHDNGVVFATAPGTALTAVTGTPATGQYNAPTDTAPGVYTFAAADAGKPVLTSYSFIPADLEEACIQMVAERYSYRQRIGEEAKSLGGQETVRFLRGGVGRTHASVMGLPPEVADLIWPYVNVIPPTIGAPV